MKGHDIQQQKGAALVESLLAYPLLLLICLGLFDLTRISAQYSTLTVIAREAVVSVNSLNGIPVGLTEFTFNGADTSGIATKDCFDSLTQRYVGVASDCAIGVLKLRIARLIQANGYSLTGSQFTAKVNRNNDPANPTVRIELVNPFKASISAPQLNIKSSAEGPYDL